MIYNQSREKAENSPQSKKRMLSMYGINKEVDFEYDEQLIFKCDNGRFLGYRDGDITIYKGIPYAEAPVGQLRWKKPQRAEKGEGVYTAYYNGPSPIQTELETEMASYYPQSEDCLYLNVWLNSTDDTKKKPVMVFIHGGSYGWGGTADPLYDGKNFVTSQKDIILVTIGYRTGLLGFVDLSYLEGGEEFPDAPNLGLYDQIEALRYIKRNISSIGGDPENITIFGESAGGGSVTLLSIIDEAKGLFKRVISESGSVALTFSREECKSFTDKLIKESGVKSMDELMSLDEKTLRAINEKINDSNNFPMRDGNLIPEDPYISYEEGVNADIDMLIGTNRNELNYWIGELGGIVQYRMGMPIKFDNDMKKIPKMSRIRSKRFINNSKGHPIWRISEYYNEIMFRLPAIRQCEGHSRCGGRTYMYYWTVPSAKRFYGACHAVELAYVFGNVDEKIYTGKLAEKEVSDFAMTAWANFARTGDPSTDDISWGQYETEYRNTMVISKTPHMVSDPLAEQRRLLMPVTDNFINPSYADLDYNVPSVRRSSGIGLLLAAAAVVGIILLLSDD